MKITKLYFTLFAAAVAICVLLLLLRPSTSTAEPKLSDRAAIIIGCNPVQSMVEVQMQTPHGTWGWFPQVGLEVLWVSASGNCPKIEKGADFAPTIALLLQQGFRIESVSGQQYFLTR